MACQRADLKEMRKAKEKAKRKRRKLLTTKEPRKSQILS
jgi:hypothetical protein